MRPNIAKKKLMRLKKWPKNIYQLCLKNSFLPGFGYFDSYGVHI